MRVKKEEFESICDEDFPEEFPDYTFGDFYDFLTEKGVILADREKLKALLDDFPDYDSFDPVGGMAPVSVQYWAMNLDDWIAKVRKGLLE